MMSRLIITCLILLFCYSRVVGQKLDKVCGEYSYVLPPYQSEEEGKRIAAGRARIEALINKYGSVVYQDNRTSVKNINGESSVNFYSFGGSDVKGEWISDIDEPNYTIRDDQGLRIINVAVCGNARAISKAVIDLDVKLLRNGLDGRFESDTYKDGDNLYMCFSTPTNGYLAVYLADAEENVFCILPYGGDTSGRVHVANNKNYLFFSEAKAESAMKSIVDEYLLTCASEVEVNQIYVIFSPNNFVKANDKHLQDGLPRVSRAKDFHKWLVVNLNRDSQMQVTIKSISINR